MSGPSPDQKWERGIYDARDMPALIAELHALRQAAADVVAWDWSDNDEECVRDMERLRALVEKAQP